MFKYRVFVSVVLFLLLGSQSAFGQITLVQLGAIWKYLDDGSDQGTAWQQPGFNYSTWSSGPAQLGYGDGDEATVVSFGSNSSNKHITTYFRHDFNLTTPVAGLELGVIRDDGVVVYLNGNEVYRSNMPTGNITASTTASSALGGSAESTLNTAFIDHSSLLIGTNTLAVEIHQANSSSSDISFDLQLIDTAVPEISRGPYLQQASDDEITIRWSTVTDRDAVVRYGTDPNNLNQFASGVSTGTAPTKHSVNITGLNPDTRYFYSIGDSTTELAFGNDYYFDTHPVAGTELSTLIWVLGDSGTANSNAAAVRDAFINYNGSPHADVWLMLGDNAYNDGTDSEYQAAVFDMYPENLRNSVLWSTLGNHDGHTADSASQSGPYYDIFTLPTDGRAGGVASGTEAYYSFDYANIHFVCLDSYETDRSPNGAMATWLQNDLAATTQEWIIAFWHHPPYSKGSHDSDTEGRLIDMRLNFLPILESHGVDLVLGGHSHSYERSMFIDGHYGLSNTFSTAAHAIDNGDGDPLGDGAYEKITNNNGGAVYSVAGSSGKITNAPLNHPIMITNIVELGSLVINVDGKTLDAVFLNNTGAVTDSFRIIHQSTTTATPNPPSNLVATAVSATEINLTWTDQATDEDSYQIERSTDQSDWATIATLASNSENYSDSGLTAETIYYYRVRASNVAGDSAWSNEASTTTDSLPEFIDYFANADTAINGTVSGSFTSTHNDDGALQTITEVESGGKPSKRRSLLEHRWQFNIQGGSTVTLYAQAYASDSTDNDDFEFAYSVNSGSSWQSLLVVSNTNTDNLQSMSLSNTTSGNVLIRVQDTDRTQGNRSLDTVFIDQLYIRVDNMEGDAPAAPSDLSASAFSATVVELSWTDNAVDESGFSVERKLGAGGEWSILESGLPSGTVDYDDNTASPNTSYVYRVQAFNNFGTSTYSNEASAMTPNGISLTAQGGKIKGVIHNTLSWSNATGAAVDIYRNNTLIPGIDNTGSYTDNTGQKGGGNFTYTICEAASTIQCSNEATVSF